MTTRNIIQTTFDEFGKASAGAKKSGSWHRRSDETVVVLSLQKSDYTTRYYVNVALWLLALGEADDPKENKCHVRTRLDDLLPHGIEKRLTELLNLESPIQEQDRREELLALRNEHLLPLMEGSATLEGLRSGGGQRLVERSLLTGPAQRLLQATRRR